MSTLNEDVSDTGTGTLAGGWLQLHDGFLE